MVDPITFRRVALRAAENRSVPLCSATFVYFLAPVSLVIFAILAQGRLGVLAEYSEPSVKHVRAH